MIKLRGFKAWNAIGVVGVGERPKCFDDFLRREEGLVSDARLALLVNEGSLVLEETLALTREIDDNLRIALSLVEDARLGTIRVTFEVAEGYDVERDAP